METPLRNLSLMTHERSLIEAIINNDGTRAVEIHAWLESLQDWEELRDMVEAVLKEFPQKRPGQLSSYERWKRDNPEDEERRLGEYRPLMQERDEEIS